ncbi:MAG: glycosyltransferase family 1 protein [Jaaginema sp. PMC 1079.18]|nr:glycosyltransferase family 1 protein [Jaaginema sp. PMC 1080.18]MEC4849637.1 glycosyltransferase family 1 protein [Jaaginema sp. PMC 1079.18]MEC4864681.1 glycosyltransferase family 1 protein [Jaaginema sp. PMC 1078.18]
MNNPKQIALISVHGDPAVEIGKEEAGGQNVYVRQVGMALSQQGWQVDLFTRRTAAQQPKIVEHTPNCRTIRLTAGPEAFIPRDEIYGFRDAFVNEFLKFQSQNNRKYALIHTNYWISGSVGLQLKAKTGIPMLHTYHSLGAVKYKSVSTIPMIATTRLAVEKACLEQADCIVATSPQEKEHMKTLVSTQGNIAIIPCGTDIERFGSISQEAARKRLGIAPDAKMVFYIGRFDPRKGIETAVRAIARSRFRNDDKLCLMIGGGSRPGHSDGNERDRIAGIVTELNLDAIASFPGRISDEDLPLYYAAADISVVPSHYEPFGLVAIEAMACGTPVVASDVGGLQYTVVSEKTGLLAPAKDTEAFAQAIDRILADPQWRSQLGVNARQRVAQKFSWYGVANQLSHLYDRVLADVPLAAESIATA